MKPSLQVKDFTKNFNEVVSRFKKDAVLVGIPETTEPRQDEEDINNATILAINHFGSEKAGIPPRPVLTIGIRNAQDSIAEQFKAMAKQVLKKGTEALTTYYERAGIIASNACKKVINDQDGIKPPSEATLKARQYLTQAGFKGTKSLLVTGQLRNSITYVVRSLWGR
jgi:hypothetical protein